MPTPRFLRNDPPPDVNHASFGEQIDALSLVDHHPKLSFARSTTILPDVPIAEVQYFVPGDLPPQKTAFLGACTAQFRLAQAGPFPATVFLPDQAVLATPSSGEFLIEESLWHSELFWTDHFRNDRTTNWKWRMDRNWKHVETLTSETAFCYHRFYFQYFHWLIDCLPRIWLLKTRPPFTKVRRWMVGPVTSGFQIETMKLFDIKPDELVWTESPVVRFDDMIYPAFEFREPIKTRPSYHNGIHHKGWSTAYISEIADRARSRLPLRSNEPSLKLYISRQDALHRKIRNEPQILRLLEELGFHVVVPGQLDFMEQVDIFSRARIVVGAHGAGLANILWMQPGSSVIEFMPSGHDDPGYRFLSELVGLQYGCVFARSFEHRQGIAYADIEVDIETLKRALNFMK